MRFEGTVYAVSERLRNVSDESWHEYEARLMDDEGGIIDEWNSRLETYNGVHGQRLSRASAEEAVEEIKQDVKDGEADSWFDTERVKA